MMEKVSEHVQEAEQPDDLVGVGGWLWFFVAISVIGMLIAGVMLIYGLSLLPRAN